MFEHKNKFPLHSYLVCKGEHGEKTRTTIQRATHCKILREKIALHFLKLLKLLDATFNSFKKSGSILHKKELGDQTKLTNEERDCVQSCKDATIRQIESYRK